MSRDRWADLRARAAEATPGEWLHTHGHGDDWIGIADGERPNFRGGIICEPPHGWEGSMEWWPANAAYIAAASPAAVLALLAERDAALEQAEDARATLSAWFDLATKAEDAGADVLRDSLNTWLRRASNGGMPEDHADIVRNVLDEAARLYLWKALVPVLRGMNDTARAALAAGEDAP